MNNMPSKAPFTQQDFYDFDFKASCRAATTANITSLSGAQTIDGVSVVADDRVLVKDQGGGASHAANGIYKCASGAWTRAVDYNSNSEVTAGSFINISEGTVNADKSFVLTTNSVDLDTTALTFLELTANVADASITYAKIQNTAANSVLVRDADSSGTVSAKALATTQILIGDGTGFTNAALSGDVTMTNAGAVTIGNDKVTEAMISHGSSVDAAVTNVLSYTSGNVVQWAPLARVCFLKGTKITLPDKSQKNIEDLCVGEMVLTYQVKRLSNLKKDKKIEIMNWSQDTMEGTFNQNKVKNIWVNPTDRYLVINDKLRITNLHIIHVKRGEEYKFLPVEKAQIGDLLFTDKGDYEPIQTIEQMNERTEVYNIEVKKNKTYFADNYLVHHFCETCSGLSGRI